MERKLILVTGAAGFIGSHLCARLAADGHQVISLDNYFTGSRENHVPGVEYREGHTKDIEKLVPETPDIIFHLGEYSRVEESMFEPNTVWDLNTAGTEGVLEFCRMRQRKKRVKLVYAGSSTKFADGGLGRDQSPYAWTKAVNTELVRNYGDWYGVPYATTYFYNVYGPGRARREVRDRHRDLPADAPCRTAAQGNEPGKPAPHLYARGRYRRRAAAGRGEGRGR